MRHVLTAGLLTAAITLTGCAAGSNATAPEPTATRTPWYERTPDPTPPPAAPSMPGLSDADALDLMRREAPDLEAIPDSLILDLMDSICEGYDGGLDTTDLIDLGLGEDLPPRVIGVLIGGAVAHKCPEHEDA
jgi:hypothetical protein